MRKFTTPTITLVVRGVDLSDKDVFVTFAQGENVTTIENPDATFDGEDTTILVPLSQVQTGGFTVGTVDVQVNFIDASGNRDATTVKAIGIDRNLLAQVIENA